MILLKTISTIAGTGTFTHKCNGVQATSASLKGPFDIALDASGNIYIGDALIKNNSIELLIIVHS
jgi:hypothetical protein